MIAGYRMLSMVCPEKLNSNTDDLAHPQSAHSHQKQHAVDDLQTHRVSPQHAHETRIDDVDNDGDYEGQKPYHPARHPALRGKYLNLSQQLEALADKGTEVSQNFGEVATGFALDQDGDNKIAHIGAGHAVGEIHQRSLYRYAVVDLVVHNAKFAFDRILCFVTYHL